MEDKFWKKHGIVIASLLVMAFVLAVNNWPRLIERIQTCHNSGDTSFNEVRWASDAAKPSVPREVLTRDAIIVLTNKARAENGLAPLVENQLLNVIADARARDMLDQQYFAHVSPTGQQASDIAQSIGYTYNVIAENIGKGDFYTNQKIVDGWMQSPGHRNNILSTDVQEIGASVMKAQIKGINTYITVQIFGRQSPPVAQKNCIAPSENLLHDIELKKAEIESFHEQLKRLKTELDEEKESIETDQRNAIGDTQKNEKLNVRINVYNEKSRWYNRLIGESNAKAKVAEAMALEYNRLLQIYKECNASHD